MPHNGNGNGALTKRTHDIQQEPAAVDGLMQLPPWLQSIRDAMGSSIGGDDLKDIMQAQIKKAKEGNIQAANFVMNQAHKMLQAEQKKVTVIQNNFYDSAGGHDASIEPGDDRQRQLKKLTDRARTGQPLAGREGDHRHRPVTDEEEKEMRRRQEAEDEG